MTLRRLERSLLLYVSVDSSSDRGSGTSIRTCSFEGAREVDPGGRSFVFTGPPPAHWDLRLEQPEIPVAPERARGTVEQLVQSWPGRGRVQYLIKASRRLAAGEDVIGGVVDSLVWALLGTVVTPTGRIVPVGLSGRGSGVDALERETAEGSFGRTLSRIDRSEPLPAGELPAVLAPAAAAVLLHEAVGHFAEAAPDGRVDLGHRLGVRIAPEGFDLYDHPCARDGVAQYPLDDEGVAVCGATEIVRDGVMMALLHCRASGRAAGTSSTGNGRAASIWDPPIPRMSNLICKPGTASEREMLERMGDGLYLHSLAYGYGFGNRIEAQVRLAEEVQGGRRTGRFRSGGIIEENRAVLMRAAELGNRSQLNRNSMCGKENQLLYDVGTRAPALRMTGLRMRP